MMLNLLTIIAAVGPLLANTEESIKLSRISKNLENCSSKT